MKSAIALFVLGLVSVSAGTTQEGLDWLAEKAKEEGVVTLESGLQYKILADNGTDDAPSPDADTPCMCHYRGTLTDGTEFDSSYKRGKPTEFAPNQVIKGWTEAMQLMKEGDKWELYIPSELAYGDAQRGEHITPGAVLVFELEILTVKGGDGDAKPKKAKKVKKEKKEKSDEVVTLNEENFDENVYGSPDVWLVEFYAPWCGHCKTLAPEWAHAASQLKGWSNKGVGARLGKVDAAAEKALGTKFEVTGFPTIKVFRPDSSGPEDAETYEGPRETVGIVETAKKYCEPVLPPIVVQQMLTSDQLHKCRTNEPEDWDAEEDGPYESDDEDAPPHWCVVAFLPHILDDKTAARNDRIFMLNKLAEKFRDDPYTILWSEGGAQYDLEQAMDLNFGFPAFAAINAEADKYAVHSGESDASTLEKYFLAAIKGGWAKTRKLQKLPKLKTATAWDGKDGAVEEEEEFDLADIMGDDWNAE